MERTVIATDILDQVLLSCISVSLIVAIIAAHITYQCAKRAETRTSNTSNTSKRDERDERLSFLFKDGG